MYNNIMHEKDVMSKKKISDFDLKINRCIYCKETFKDHTIYENDEHGVDCPWKYYLRCLSCGSKNHLSILTENMECTCSKEK